MDPLTGPSDSRLASAHHNPLRVLLVSAVGGVDPHSGDVTYTESLLANPPPGVAYTTYVDALRDGTLFEWGRRTSLRPSPRWVGSIPGPLVGAARLALARAEGGIREVGLGFRESTRVFSVDPEAFDVVHVHVFHTRFLDPSPPVVMSAAGPLEWVYRDARGWRPTRLRMARLVDQATGRVRGATMCTTRRGNAAVFVSFSEHVGRLPELRRGGWRPEDVHVVPNYLPDPAVGQPSGAGSSAPDKVPTIGFVSKDFDAKGGPDVLAAFEVVRRDAPSARLVVIGSEPRLDPAEAHRRGITWLPFVPRDELLTRWLPTFDVFLYPSHFDGLPYAVIEALAHGIPVVVSDYQALPELARDGAGAVAPEGDVAALAAAVLELGLLEPQRRATASRAARSLFERRYAAQSQAPLLRAAYDAALARNQREVTR